MKGILIFLLLYSFPLFSQTVYLPHEIEMAAEPMGGLNYLNQFITSNLKIPFKSTVKGINKKVYVKGIVEPDGSMSQLEISRGIDSLCDQEAIRVLGLYKAWKPATVKGEKVRQTMVYPVSFRAQARPDFDSTELAFINYFDKQFKPATDAATYQYRHILPVDKNGYVNKDVVIEQLKNKKWKRMVTVPFLKKEIWHKTGYIENRMDSVRTYQISARDGNMASFAAEATFQLNGKLLALTDYNSEGKTSLIQEYDLKGMLRKTNTLSDSTDTEIRWHANGQIQSVVERTVVIKAGETSETHYINRWEQDGTQRIKNGDGHWESTGAELNGKTFIEEGNVVVGKKNGMWTGKFADSTLIYQEIYELGSFQEGFSMVNGEKIVYNEPVKQPHFKGGMAEFYKFLGTNIHYPMEAARNRVKGRVFLSFVVCEDGSLCDYKVDKSAGPDLDSEALRVVKKMNGMWEPGAVRGNKVRVKYNLPINFEVSFPPVSVSN
ncbi:energy transducer TonB [Dyadobacter sp. NIV53]|uniref:energy transducer TonB n=1 Tax=Dyadobacter sp. NIV53 TaxID=2861765 RepID=UPI001C8605B1|nr:energy transducer TonB [Dyadobacter sp. NIV53]